MSDLERKLGSLPPREEQALHSLSEIAEYVGGRLQGRAYSERTIREYIRERGLPAFKVGPRWVCLRSELEAWVNQQLGLSEPRRTVPAFDERVLAPRVQWKRLSLILSGLVAAVLVLLLIGRFSRGVNVFNAHLEGNTLVAVDERGEVLWAKVFEDIYSGIHQLEQVVWVRDINGDDRSEVVVIYWPREYRARTGRVVAYGSSGEELWSESFEAELTVHERQFEPYYRPYFLRWLEIGGRELLLVVAFHGTYYPCRVVLLDPKDGRWISDYWHPGYIQSIRLFDIDRDGSVELLVGGINNPGPGLGRPSLAVLDLPLARSENPSGGNFFGAWNEMEQDYLLFPRLDLFTARNSGGGVNQIGISRKDRFFAEVTDGPHSLIYYFDSSLEVLDVRPGDELIRNHDLEFQKGNLDHRFSPQELERWKNVLRFPTAPDGNDPAYEALLDR